MCTKNVERKKNNNGIFLNFKPRLVHFAVFEMQVKI